MRGKHKRKKQREQALPRSNTPPVPASTNQESPTKEQSKTEIDHGNNTPMRRFKVTEFLARNFKLILESVAVVAAVAVLAVYALQLRVMYQTEKIDQRAWVSVTMGDLEINKGKPVTAQLHFSNTGKTPARNAQGFARIKMVSVGDEVKLEDLAGLHSVTRLVVGNLFPNESNADLTVYMVTDAKPGETAQPIIADQDMFNAATNRTHYFLIYGRISYDDALGNSHWVGFCGLSENIYFDTPPPCLAYNDFDHE